MTTMAITTLTIPVRTITTLTVAINYDNENKSHYSNDNENSHDKITVMTITAMIGARNTTLKILGGTVDGNFDTTASNQQ